MFRAGRTQILVFHAPCLCERISQYQANEFVNYKSLQTFSFFLTLFLPTFFLRVYPFYLDCLPPLIFFSVCLLFIHSQDMYCLVMFIGSLWRINFGFSRFLNCFSFSFIVLLLSIIFIPCAWFLFNLSFLFLLFFLVS